MTLEDVKNVINHVEEEADKPRPYLDKDLCLKALDHRLDPEKFHLTNRINESLKKQFIKNQLIKMRDSIVNRTSDN
jgi:hypothetical protein